MINFVNNVIISIIVYYFTLLINVCVHELGHGIAAKILGLNFRIEIGKGEKLFQITDHFIFFRKLIPGPHGYTDLFSDNDFEKYKKLSCKKRLFFKSGGILVQLILMVIIGVLLYYDLGTDYSFLDGFYKLMLLSSIALLLVVIIPSPKRQNDSYMIYSIFLEMKQQKK